MHGARRDIRRESWKGECGGKPLALPMALWLALQLPASAADITVDGTCLMTDAIAAANGDTIVGDCGPGVGTDTILLTLDVVLDAPFAGDNGLPPVETEIVVAGDGHSVLRNPVAASGFRIFEVAPSGRLTLRNTTVGNGGSGPSRGGAVFNEGTLALESSTIVGSYASGSGGGIYNLGTLTVTTSTLSGNDAYFEGGGIYNAAAGHAVVDRSTVSGGEGLLGGGIFNSGTLDITASTISGNNAVSGTGGGVLTVGGTTTLLNSTVHGNTAGAGGGIAVYDGTITLSHTTFAGNEASYPGYGSAVYNYGVVYVGGSLLESATALVDSCGGSGVWVDGGANLADDTSCAAIPDTLTGLTGVLANNSGPTETVALVDGSSAINAGGDCGLATDQRGRARINDCDSGSFEYKGCPVLVLSDEAVTAPVTHESCQIVVGPSLTIETNGDLSLTHGHSTVFVDGVGLVGDGSLTVASDPLLIP